MQRRPQLRRAPTWWHGPKAPPPLTGVTAVLVGVVVVAATIGSLVAAAPMPVVAPAATGVASPGVAPPPESWRFERLARPSRTVVRDPAGATLAVLTDGARTVRLTGPVRTFIEPGFTTASVTTDAWVRIAPQPWVSSSIEQPWFRPWLSAALRDPSPDLFEVAMQYLHGAAQLVDQRGVRYAGDASFGPLSADDPDGREENSDFLDYLGIGWTFPDTGPARPKPDRFGNVDCSGFLRLVYGYRLGYPLLGGNSAGAGLPRRAYAMSAFGPGTLIIANSGAPPAGFDRLQAGDLVFFDTALDGRGRTDHSGFYLGVDSAGRHRFVSSRSRADGPTFGDLGGAATLDGSGYWAARFRAARRI